MRTSLWKSPRGDGYSDGLSSRFRECHTQVSKDGREGGEGPGDNGLCSVKKEAWVQILRGDGGREKREKRRISRRFRVQGSVSPERDWTKERRYRKHVSRDDINSNQLVHTKRGDAGNSCIPTQEE